MSGSVSLGLLYALTLKGRIDNLKELQRILNYVVGEITYKQSVLSEAFLGASIKSREPFRSWLCKLGESLLREEYADSSFYEVYESTLDDIRIGTRLRKTDMDILRSVGQAFGYLDVNTQRMSIKFEQDNLAEVIRQAESEVTNKSRISVVIGALSGIMVIIVLI